MENMNTKNHSPSLEQALSSIPKPLRKRLLKNYSTIKSTSLKSKYDSIGHQAGKLAEVLLRVLQNQLTRTYTPLSQEIRNFKNECELLEQTPKTAGPDGLRILMPRVLVVMYTMRNKRDFGHTGGEVDANKIDAYSVIQLSDWCICELVRIFLKIPIEDAQLLCDAISDRQLPVVWEILGRKRVLDISFSYKDQTLLLLYSDVDSAIPTEDLFEWTEHSNRTNYRRDVLLKLHKERLIEWDKKTEMAIISPTGINEIENNILPKNLKSGKE